jgi:glucose/mannose-6-phosphate isomerase
MEKNLKQLQSELDPKNVFGSILLFPTQCESGYQAGEAVVFPESYKTVSNVLVLGMGGSALPGHIVKSQNVVTLPFEIWSRYGLPEYVSEKTLVIAMSYSGSTEETLSALSFAESSGAKIAVITVGGQLQKIAEEKKYPLALLSEETNPCQQPRFGLGGALFALISILKNLGLLSQKVAMDSVLSDLNKGPDESIAELAEKLNHKNPVVVGAEHLGQVAHFLQNQFNETSKAFAVYHELPELNHHLLEGLSFPNSNKENLAFIFFTSEKYSDRIKKRIEVTKEVVTKQGIEAYELPISGEGSLSEAVRAIYASEYLSYYLGLLHGVDPSQIPWVTYLKEKLK